MPLDPAVLLFLVILASVLASCCFCVFCFVVYTSLVLKRVGVDTSAPPSDRYVAVQSSV